MEKGEREEASCLFLQRALPCTKVHLVSPGIGEGGGLTEKDV